MLVNTPILPQVAVLNPTMHRQEVRLLTKQPQSFKSTLNVTSHKPITHYNNQPKCRLYLERWFRVRLLLVYWAVKEVCFKCLGSKQKVNPTWLSSLNRKSLLQLTLASKLDKLFKRLSLFKKLNNFSCLIKL